MGVRLGRCRRRGYPSGLLRRPGPGSSRPPGAGRRSRETRTCGRFPSRASSTIFWRSFAPTTICESPPSSLSARRVSSDQSASSMGSFERCSSTISRPQMQGRPSRISATAFPSTHNSRCLTRPAGTQLDRCNLGTRQMPSEGSVRTAPDSPARQDRLRRNHHRL